jgi:hypothetical protein
MMRRATVFGALAICSAWVVGCGSVSQKGDAGKASDAGFEASAAPDAAADQRSDLASGTPDGGDGGGAADGGGGDAAPLTAQPLRTQSGAYFTFNGPAAGAPATIYGTDAYTDDSSICTAAVHAGLITPTAGGSVVIEIIPGLASYAASVRNGITSLSFAAWTASFRFPAATTWTTSATLYRGLNNLRLRYVCPAQGSITAGSVYGSDIYSDDSPVCIAAVHAGVIVTAAAGGSVQIEIVPGQSSYAATTRNGVTSVAYGVWAGSYIFPPS